MNTTIDKTIPTSNFTILPNILINDTSLPIKIRGALESILSLPPKWRLNIKHIASLFNCCTKTAYKYLRLMVDAGYATMTRFQGHVEWRFYKTPQTQQAAVSPVESHCGTFYLSKSFPTYKTNKETERKELTTTHSIENPVEQEKAVVVFVDEKLEKSISETIEVKLPEIDIPEIEPAQRPAAKKILSKITPAQVATVLAVFITAIKTKPVNNKIGYLQSLVSAVINGTFTPPGGAQAANIKTLDERMAEQKTRRIEAQERGRMSNDEWAAKTKALYSDKADCITTISSTGGEQTAKMKTVNEHLANMKKALNPNLV